MRSPLFYYFTQHRIVRSFLPTIRDKLSVPFTESGSPIQVWQTTYSSFAPSFRENINKIFTSVFQGYTFTLVLCNKILSAWQQRQVIQIQWHFTACIRLRRQGAEISHRLTSSPSSAYWSTLLADFVSIARVLKHLKDWICLHHQGTEISYRPHCSPFSGTEIS